MDIPDKNLPRKQKDVDVEIEFGNTELKVTATYRRTGKKTDAKFEFEMAVKFA